MLANLHGPWLICAAVLLIAVAAARGPRPDRRELWLLGWIVAAAAAARLGFGIWGPLHNNGQGPLWIRGALEPAALAGYGPGYFELFTWVTKLSSWPAFGGGVPVDRALFAANALLSAVSPAVLYAAARLAGVGRGGALAVTLIMASDPVAVRTAASEGYFTAQIALVLGAEASVALAAAAHRRDDGIAIACALGAAGLLAASAARLHPMAYLPIAGSALVMFGAVNADWRTRVLLTAAAAAASGGIVILTSINTVVAVLGTSEMSGSVLTGMAPRHAVAAVVLFAAVLAVHRWARPPWLPVVAAFSVAAMLATQERFEQHPIWTLCYQRLFFPGLLLGAASLLPSRLQAPRWAVASAAVVVALLLAGAEPHLGVPNTEQLEYRYLQGVLRDMPDDCVLTGVSRAGNRVWELPSHLLPRRPGRGAGTRRDIQDPAELRGMRGGCVLYVHSSLCTSAEGRPLCDAVEHGARLQPVTSAVFPAQPSFVWLPYDRPQVEVAVFRVIGTGGRGNAGTDGGGTGEAADAVTDGDQVAVGDGAAITSELAQALYQRIAPLHEADQCGLLRLDTSRFRIRIGLQTRSGAAHDFEIAIAPQDDAEAVGGWTVVVPPVLRRECPQTLAAIERVLRDDAAAH